MTSQKLTKKDYMKLAKEAGLSEMEAKHYTLFMLKRFPNEFYKPYAFEWAMRFKNEKDWMLADNQSQAILIEVGHRDEAGRLMK